MTLYTCRLYTLSSTQGYTVTNKNHDFQRYPAQEGKTDGSETTSNEHQKLYYHRLGTNQSEVNCRIDFFELNDRRAFNHLVPDLLQDVLVVEFPDNPKWRIAAEVSDCGKYLIVCPQQDCRDNLVYYADISEAMKTGIQSKIELTPLVTKFEADYDVSFHNAC